MLSEEILLSLNAVQDEYLDQAWERLSRPAAVKNMREKVHHKISKTALIAAVLVALLTVSAFAIGYSFYRRYQSDVREELKIDENQVSGYIEYEEESVSPAGTADAGTTAATIQLISSIDCGETVKVYFCVSPVSPEMFEGAFGSGDVDDKTCLFRWFASNDARIGETFEMEMRGETIPFSYDSFYASVGISLSEEEIQEHTKDVTEDSGETVLGLDHEYYWNRISEAYDKETECLFLQSTIRKAAVDTAKPIYFSVGLLDAKSITVPLGEHIDIGEWRKEHLPVYLEDYGTAVIAAAQADSRTFDLSNGFVELTNPSNAGNLKIMSASVYPTYAELKITHDDIRSIYNLPEDLPTDDSEAFRKAFEKQLEWTGFYDAILQNSEILFADGESLSLAPSDSVPYENGIVTLRSYFTSTIDISRVSELKIFDSVIPVL